jgi:hypothetical protein
MFGPAVHVGLEERAVDEQLTATLEEVEQSRLAVRPVEHILLLHGRPWHPAALGGKRVLGAHVFLFLH